MVAAIGRKRVVRNEASLGKEREKLAAVQIEICELPIAFSSTHYETIHESDFGDDHPGWHKLLERVGQLTGRPALASYARALAAAQKDLSAWAQNNPDEPLAAKANQIVRELSERPVEGAHKRRPYFRIGLDISIGLLGIFLPFASRWSVGSSRWAVQGMLQVGSMLASAQLWFFCSRMCITTAR